MVNLLSFKTELEQALTESISSVEESVGHVLIDIVPTAVVKVVSHLKSKKDIHLIL